MQKHKLPSGSTSRNEKKSDATTTTSIEPPAMQSSISLPTSREESSSISAFSAALNLPDLSTRKEMAFRKQSNSSRGGTTRRKETNNDEALPCHPPPVSSSSSASYKHSRSSLSAQLTGPLAALEGVTASLRSRGKKEGGVDQDEPLWKGTVKRMTVGRCASTSSSALTAYPDRLEYKFHSSSGSSVAMTMFFRDMDPSTVVLDKATLAFHISTPLIQFSSSDYEHTDPSDLLSLTFFTIQDVRDFARSLRSFLPLS